MELNIRDGAQGYQYRKDFASMGSAAIVTTVNSAAGRAHELRLRWEIAMAEIGELSKDPDAGRQFRPFESARQSRTESWPAQSVLDVLRVEGLIAMTVNARALASSGVISLGWTLFHPEASHGFPG